MILQSYNEDEDWFKAEQKEYRCSQKTVKKPENGKRGQKMKRHGKQVRTFLWSTEPEERELKIEKKNPWSKTTLEIHSDWIRNLREKKVSLEWEPFGGVHFRTEEEIDR